MPCEYCLKIISHDYRCPNYEPPKTRYQCYICENGIQNGEEYVRNFDEEYVHYDCLTNLSNRAMIKWLGGEIKEMDGDYEY